MIESHPDVSSRGVHTRRVRWLNLALLAGPCCVAALASAQETDLPKPPPRYEGFQLDLTLDAWFPRLVGDIGVAGGDTSTSDLELRNSEVSFFGDARMSWDKLWVDVSGFSFETDGSNASVRSDASWWDVSVDVGYALWRPFAAQPFPWSPAPTGEVAWSRVDLTVGPTLGVSYDDFRFSTTPTGGARDAVDGAWCSVRGGFDINLSIWLKDRVGFLESLDIVFGGSIGPCFGASGDADGTGTLWMLDAALILRISPNIGAHLGYRLIDADFDYGDRSADVSLRGLVAGATIRF